MIPPARSRSRSARCAGTSWLILLCLCAAPGAAQRLLPPDPAATIGNQISFDGFVDEQGRDFISVLQLSAPSPSPRPWIVSPIYARCLHTCSPITANLRTALEHSGLQASEYRVASFSFDPDETAAALTTFRQKLQLPPEWLTLRAADRQALTRTLAGLDFRTISMGNGQFDHPNLIVILTPDMRLAQYLFGISFEPAPLAAAVRRARGGIPWLAGREGYVFAISAIGLVVSALVFFSLWSNRRPARPRG